MTQSTTPLLTGSELLRITKAPGAQYILVNGTDILEECCAGYADLITKKPVTIDTTFNNFSVTKTATAAAILKLAEEKKIGLTDFVNPLFNEYHFKYPFTLQQLVCHQAGFPDPIPISWIHLAGEDKSFPENNFISETVKKHSNQLFVPGSRFKYSSVGYLLLSQIIEKITGDTYLSYITGNILSKIRGQGSLGFSIERESGHATGYHPRYSFSNLLLASFLDRKKYIRYNTSSWTAFENFYVNGKSYGGFIGNGRGLAAYLQAFLENRIFTGERTRQLMFTEQKGGMSYGWFTGALNGERYVCHAGGGGGYYCEIRIYPELRLASVLLRNRSSFSDIRLLDKIDSRLSTVLYQTR